MKDRIHRGIRVPWNYLVADHGEATLMEWAQKLHYFRFCRAVPGGHAADGDSLLLTLEDSAVPQRLIRDNPDPDRRDRLRFGATSVCYYYGEGTICLSLSGAGGNCYSVTVADVENALAIEATIRPLAACVIDPPLDSPFCIAPEFWPEFWR